MLDTFVLFPEEYPFLNPSFIDDEHNTILHHVMKLPYSNKALEAVELICSYPIDTSICNKDGKTAHLCIPAGFKDRRLPYVINLMKTQSVLSSHNVEYEEGHQTKVGKSDNEREENQINVESIKRAEAVETKNEMDVGHCRQLVRKTLEKLPNFEFELYPKTKVELKAIDSQPKNTLLISDKSSTEVVKPPESGVRENQDDADVDQDMLEDDLQASDNGGKVEPDSVILDEINDKMFDDLEWEVECTAEVWKWLGARKVPEKLKTKVVNQLKQLASGEWSTVVRKPLAHVPADIELYEIKLTKAARVIWQLAVAFSPRRSETGFISSLSESSTSAINGCIYTEIIRVWDVVLNHNHLNAAIERIVKSNQRGRECSIQKQLTGIQEQNVGSSGGKYISKRLPRLWMEIGPDRQGMQQVQGQKLYPPGSANEKEYHIMKFYAFNSSLIGTILHNQQDVKIDFPFRVTELEHAIITLRPSPPAPIILLGRSGTGKTTCCLYRLWSNFVRYWTRSSEGGEPWIPRTVDFKHIEGTYTYFNVIKNIVILTWLNESNCFLPNFSHYCCKAFM